MKPVTNEAMLITYADSLGGDLAQLQQLLDHELSGAFGGVHVLPFYPSSGDRGFAVVHYDTVDPRFGTWDDIERLAEHHTVMVDFMINHVSVRSAEFRDYLARGDASPYREMFIRWDEFWPGGAPTPEDLETLYSRREGGPVRTYTRADGTDVQLWSTFFAEQVDVDPFAAATQEHYRRTLGRLAQLVPIVRFDAFAYASKRPGTSCFFVEPEVWQVLDIGMEPLRAAGTQMLPEVHERYEIQLAMAERGLWVYDFALPMLTLHALMTGRTDRLRHWLEICPRRQFTTLDTHDGIGVVDVAGLLSEDEVDLVSERVSAVIADSRHLVTGREPVIRRDGQKARRYQLMCTFHDALSDDDAHLLARVLQLFVPGIPQVYYVGALFGGNDLEALEAVGDPRAINRHDYTVEEVRERVTDPHVALLLDVLRWRNRCAAFDGDLTVTETDRPGELLLRWTAPGSSAQLRADLREHTWQVTETADQEDDDDAVPTAVFRSLRPLS
ncbi:sucrose phosphorylase [Quadrisphaera oryzae]|uniref:sucrose phosphorylase n=1 Tax=Quadrisphaera TaxID=317661 RepID=UPI00164559B8|nr:sucrose phosphorylase [Quadrisphaera sp. RL12-1S]MBC3760839.1 sucrose phosphorylase [Quadrisphaera sp. RL12-1S]